MNRGFWDKLTKPIMILAPMANVTDFAFRKMIAQYGKPDVMWTEFVSVDGLCSPGKERLMIDLKYSEIERPIVAQFFGSKPENFYKCAQLAQELKFDGIDINMGCPDKSVEKQGAGAALMKNPKLAKEIILATQEGAGELPVSVKTRLGYNKIDFEDWLPTLFEAKPAAVIFHLRTRKEMSKVPAHWEVMPEIMSLIGASPLETRGERGGLEAKPSDLTPPTQLSAAGEVGDFSYSKRGFSAPLILGNGDVMSLQQGIEKCAQTGADGVMFGRGIFGNPWLFNREIRVEGLEIRDKLKVMIEHTKLFEKTFISARGGPASGGKSFEVMKKHYKAYVNNFEGAKELRAELMEGASTAQDVERIVKNFLLADQK
ncbi:MAG: tRNA-dihydrouridine synthase [Candidatus Doudnabacteria bacterium]|nr:tRNA-dihydrouridine synthase [Candidatus Doudnabacteria bacterium]